MGTKATHKVIDQMYHEGECGHDAYYGSQSDCHKWIEEQAEQGQVFTYKVVPISDEEAKEELDFMNLLFGDPNTDVAPNPYE